MTGSVKLGHPVPDSNFVFASNSSAPHPAQRYTPSSWQFQYLPVNGRSVPALLSTSYCSGLSSDRHSASVFSTSRVIIPPDVSLAPTHGSLARWRAPRSLRLLVAACLAGLVAALIPVGGPSTRSRSEHPPAATQPRRSSAPAGGCREPAHTTH